MNSLKQRLGKRLSRYLSEPGHTAGTAAPTRTDLLAQVLQTGDVLLVEGTSRVSSAIKYLTQSTWSHAALYVGKSATGESQFLEADMVHGVRLVPLAHFTGFHCRVCRPVSLSEAERKTVCNFALARVGLQYDMKNIVDLARYLLPNPPVPMRWRRQMLSLGSGDPTRAICSTLVAEAFASVNYPILPTVETLPAVDLLGNPHAGSSRELLHIRHHSLYVPRDFDVSPYFQIVKPTIEVGFDHHFLTWAQASSE
ncbi:MAG: YiiX/YebB-like N1pC/P60 family cysteine hydrolase [Burkholderiaceae bacterium]